MISLSPAKSNEKYRLIIAGMAFLVLLTCGHYDTTDPGYTIAGSIQYNHHFSISTYNYGGVINIIGSVPFQIHISPADSGTMSGGGTTDLALVGMFHEIDDTCITRGWGDNQVILSGTLNSSNPDSQVVTVNFDETWYNPGAWEWHCTLEGNVQGQYGIEHHQFSAKFDMHDSTIVQLDSTIDFPHQMEPGYGTYRWTMRLTPNND